MGNPRKMKWSMTVCRLCLEENKQNCSKFTKDDKLIVAISTLTSLEVLSPSIDVVLVCKDCQKLLEDYQSFRESCLQNDELFRKRVECEDGTSVWAPNDDKIECSKLEDVLKLDEAKMRDPIDERELLLEPEIQLLETSTVCDDPPKGKSSRAGVKTNRTLRKKTTEAVAIRKQSKDQKANEPTKRSSRRCTPPPRNQSFPCEECGKMITGGNMKKHQATHKPQTKNMFCSHCGKAFRHPNMLKVHINSHHTFEKKYECEICGKVYFRSNSLREHVFAKHAIEKRYQCKVCDMQFTNYAKKNYHYIKVHTVAKPHSCQYCDKAFKIKSDLTLHIRTHTGEKPFECDICGKKFNKSYNVVIHKKSHRNSNAAEPQTADNK